VYQYADVSILCQDQRSCDRCPHRPKDEYVARLTRAEQREVTRERLIEAAGRVFCRTGFEAAPIDLIAEEAGFSRGAFYSNFESKDELFVELISRHLDAEVETLGHALDRIESAHDLAPAIERRYRVLGEDHSWCLLTTEFQLYTMRGGLKAGEFGEIYECYRRRVGDLLALHFERLGIESSLTPYEFGVSQIALAHGLALQRAANETLDQTLPARALATFVRVALADR
jgi:AcrR family transcriptional regulator